MTWERKFKSINFYIDQEYKRNMKLARKAYELGRRDYPIEGRCHALGMLQLKIACINSRKKNRK